MVSLVKNPDLFGGQGVGEPPRLCLDCKHRPLDYGRGERRPPACTQPNVTLAVEELNALDTRDFCKGRYWEFSSPLGARQN